MRRKKSIQQMSVDELIQLAKDHEEARQRSKARRRERQQWLKTAPREETALKYRAEEKPCSVALYLQAERFILRWLPEFPDLRRNAIYLLLTLAHNILHLLHPELSCTGSTIAECKAFSIHEICSAAIEIGLNFRPDPMFELKPFQVAQAMLELSHGLDWERVRFDTLLGDIPIDL